MPMDSYKLDPIDIGLLNLLQKDGDLTLKELAHTLKKNKSVIGERVQRLKRLGCIQKIVAIIDVKKFRSIFIAFPLIQLKDHSEKTLRKFLDTMQQHPEIMECHHIMGQYDFILKVVLSDTQSYNEFLRKHISTLPDVAGIQSFPVLSESKRETAYRL